VELALEREQILQQEQQLAHQQVSSPVAHLITFL
jgi:hypothetical protein